MENTNTQIQILNLMEYISDSGVYRPLTALEIGLVLKQPHDRAEAWARCHLRALIEAGDVVNTDGGYVLRRHATA